MRDFESRGNPASLRIGWAFGVCASAVTAALKRICGERETEKESDRHTCSDIRHIQ